MKPCPVCHRQITTVIDEPVAGISITIDVRPVTWTQALRAIVEGRRAVTVTRYRHRGRSTVEYHRVTSWRIPAGQPHGEDVHVEHRCKPEPEQGTLDL